MQSSTQQPQNSPHPRKGTPGRRRNNRPVSQSQGRKTYASENDMPSDARNAMDFALGPFTPQKSPANSPALLGGQQSNPKSKARNGTKPRPTNVSTSPGPAKSDRKTPPYHTGPKTSTGSTFTSEAAFAGATFHASPAPASLPIPSFLAKAMDSPSVKDQGRVSQEPSPPATDSETPTPQHQASTAKPLVEETPLDLFFRADRAEKERARRASSANALSEGPGPFSPPLQTMSPQEPKTAPQINHLPQVRRAPYQRSSSGIPPMELDGTPGRPMGPAFSTPYHDRIRAARSSEKHLAQSQNPQIPSYSSPQPQSPPADRSEELMRFLGVKPTSPSTMNGLHSSPSHASRAVLASVNGHDQRGSASSALPQRVDSARSANVQRMEDDLRKMLNISKLNLGSVPAAASYQSS